MSQNGSLDILVGKRVIIDWMNTERDVERINDTYEVRNVFSDRTGRTHLGVSLGKKSEVIPIAGFERGIIQIRHYQGHVIFANPHAEVAYANGGLTSQKKDELFEKGEWKI